MITTTTEAPRYQEGDRVRVNKQVSTIPALPSYTGTIKEVIQIYSDNAIGYNVSLDDDPRSTRVWFFLQDQLTATQRGT